MFSVGRSETISRDMSSLFFAETELAKSREFSSNLCSYQQSRQQQQQSLGLTRFRSAPSSLLESLLDACDGGGADEFLDNRSPTLESESMFASFMSCLGSDKSENEVTPQNDIEFSATVKEETVEPAQQFNVYNPAASHMVYDASLSRDLPADDTLTRAAPVRNSSMAMENSTQMKTSTGNYSNLIKQNSSPAEFFSGFSVTGEIENFRAGSMINKEAIPSTSRSTGHINFSTRPPSSRLPQIAENGSNQTGSYTNNGGNCSYPGLKRSREDDAEMFTMKQENGGSRTYTSGLTNHLSLTKNSAEMVAIEKFLQFHQDSVPCKIRAKRGHATHPRSIAERTRRTRISQRMKKLQDLFPQMDKQTSTADMLDMAVEYIKDLQREVQILSDIRDNCTCSSNKERK